MNTIQNPIVLSPAARHLIKEAWKVIAREKKGTASQNAAYHLLLGHDLDRAFTPLKRESKIKGYANGNPYMARDLAKFQVENGSPSALSPWAELLKSIPRSTSWSKSYEGGLEQWRLAIEAYSLELEKSKEEILTTA